MRRGAPRAVIPHPECFRGEGPRTDAVEFLRTEIVKASIVRSLPVRLRARALRSGLRLFLQGSGACPELVEGLGMTNRAPGLLVTLPDTQ